MSISDWLDTPTSLQLFPNPVLFKKAEPITSLDNVNLVAERMFKVMYDNRGIGLAGNQVGLLHRIFILNKTGDPTRADEERVFINPNITKTSNQIHSHQEGCLSLPGIYANVNRPFSVIVEWMGLDGKQHKANYASLFARTIFHEYDHLNGTLFTDRITPEEKKRINLDSLLLKLTCAVAVLLDHTKEKP